MDLSSVLFNKKIAGTGGTPGPGPSGTIEITENGTYDVAQYAEADVNVSSSSDMSRYLLDGANTTHFSMKVPDEVTILRDRAFSDTCLGDIDLNQVQTIGTNSFLYSEMDTIDLDGVNTIKYGAFSGSTLKSIKIPQTVKTMETNIFANCASLSNVTYDTDIDIPSGCFSKYSVSHANQSDTFSISFGPNGTPKNISADAFKGIYPKSGGWAISLPSSLEKINEAAFAFSSLTSISGGENVIFLGPSAFNSCPLTTAANFPYLVSIGDSAFAYTNITEFTIAPNTINLGANVFYGSKIQRLDLSNVYPINWNLSAFAGMSSLTDITINNPNFRWASSKSGYTNAVNLSGCSALPKLKIPYGLVTFDGYPPVLANCTSLTLVDFSDRDSYKFERMSMPTSIRTIVLRPTTMVPSSSISYLRVNALESLYVPDDLVETYKTATGWSTYASKIKPISEYVES